MALWILRTAFVIIAAGVGIGLINSGALQGMHGYWTWIAFVLIVTASIGIIVTFLTKPPKKEKVVGLTIDTLDEAMEV